MEYGRTSSLRRIENRPIVPVLRYLPGHIGRATLCLIPYPAYSASREGMYLKSTELATVYQCRHTLLLRRSFTLEAYTL